MGRGKDGARRVVGIGGGVVVSLFLLKQECDGEIYLAAYVEGWFYLLDEAFPVCCCVFVR